MALMVPSLRGFDFARLHEDLEYVRKAGASAVHIDVCDGHFAPGITVGQPVVERLHKATRLRLDLHLLVERPERFLDDFLAAGAGRIAICSESTSRCVETLRKVRAAGIPAGVAFDAGVPAEILMPAFGEIDFLILAAGESGKNAAACLPSLLRRVQTAAAARRAASGQFTLEVEGAIEPEWAQAIEKAGADVFIVSLPVRKVFKPAIN